METIEKEGYQVTRTEDPETSHAAGDKIVRRLREIQLRVLKLFREHGDMTQHEAIELYRATYGHVAEATVRTRVSELVKDHEMLADSGTKAIVAGGGKATVWTLTAKGREFEVPA